MKNFKKWQILLVVAFAITLFANLTIPSSAAKNAKLNKSSMILIKGQSFSLKAKRVKGKIKWSSSNKSIATVSKKGKVKAIKAGTTVITAKYGKKKLKCKLKVEAPYISATYISIKKGTSYTVKMNGSTQKVSWSTSNGYVATVSNGKVTAKGKGTAIITATISNKKYNCKVTVTEPVKKVTTSEPVKKVNYASNVSYKSYRTDRGVIVILNNNNSCTISVEGQVVFYNASGKMIGTSSQDNYSFAAKSSCALFYDGILNSNDNFVDYDHYKVSFIIEKARTVDKTRYLQVSHNRGAENVMIECKNNSDKYLDFIQLAIVFFDENGKPFAYDYTYAECAKSGTTDFIQFNYPYDNNYEVIRPASYKVYLNEAYYYN